MYSTKKRKIVPSFYKFVGVSKFTSERVSTHLPPIPWTRFLVLCRLRGGLWFHPRRRGIQVLYPVLEFQAYSNTSCRLCDGTIVELPPPPVPVPVRVPEPTTSPVSFSPPNPPTRPQSISSSTRRSNQNNIGFVIGFVVCGLVAVLIMSFIIIVTTTKRRATAGGVAGVLPRSTTPTIAQEVLESNTTNDIEVEELPGDEYSTS